MIESNGGIEWIQVSCICYEKLEHLRILIPTGLHGYQGSNTSIFLSTHTLWLICNSKVTRTWMHLLQYMAALE